MELFSLLTKLDIKTCEFLNSQGLGFKIFLLLGNLTGVLGITAKTPVRFQTDMQDIYFHSF